MFNSRSKGARGELEACEALARIGLDCRRTVQYNGKGGVGDIVCDGANIHFEVKRTEHFRLYFALDQALTDRKGDSVPVLVHRPSHKPWVLIMRVDDVPRFVEEYNRGNTRVPSEPQAPEAL
jgi:Holliday junction resolvase